MPQSRMHPTRGHSGLRTTGRAPAISVQEMGRDRGAPKGTQGRHGTHEQQAASKTVSGRWRNSGEIQPCARPAPYHCPLSLLPDQIRDVLSTLIDNEAEPLEKGSPARGQAPEVCSVCVWEAPGRMGLPGHSSARAQTNPTQNTVGLRVNKKTSSTKSTQPAAPVGLGPV